jgi:hypothetical protein
MSNRLHYGHRPAWAKTVSQMIQFVLTVLRASERFFLAVDLRLFRARIRHGGDPDLYRGIRALDPRVPIRPEIRSLLMWSAESIRTLFPGRVPEPLRHAVDASILVQEFCENPATSREDILRVLDFDL